MTASHRAKPVTKKATAKSGVSNRIPPTRARRPRVTPKQIWAYYRTGVVEAPVVRRRATPEEFMSRFTIKDAVIFTLVGIVVLLKAGMI